MIVREWTTISCANKNHSGCPGWFREDVVQPWSNASCACRCHLQGPLSDRDLMGEWLSRHLFDELPEGIPALDKGEPPMKPLTAEYTVQIVVEGTTSSHLRVHAASDHDQTLPACGTRPRPWDGRTMVGYPLGPGPVTCHRCFWLLKGA